MGDSYRCQAGSPASASDLLAHLKSSLGASSSKSAKTYAALAAGKLPGAQAKLDARDRDQQRAAPSAFFSPRDSPSPDLLAKVGFQGNIICVLFRMSSQMQSQLKMAACSASLPCRSHP
jgi:hypothetical protein